MCFLGLVILWKRRSVVGVQFDSSGIRTKTATRIPRFVALRGVAPCLLTSVRICSSPPRAERSRKPTSSTASGHSLPYAWETVSLLVAEFRVGASAGFADNQVPPPDEQARAQLLRALASDSIRGALERHFGVTLAFRTATASPCCGRRGQQRDVPGVRLAPRVRLAVPMTRWWESFPSFGG